MGKADSLFDYLCSTTPAKSSLGKKKKQKNDPNVRTLNTLLRGCMWTAATSRDDVRSTDKGATKLIGGIMTASRAWDTAEKREIALDTSSYEYYLTILAQSLRFETAERLIGQMKAEFEPDVLSESLAVCWVAIARAHLFLGRVDDAARCAQNAQMYFDRKRSTEESTGRKEEGRKIHSTTGGKQSKHGTSRREHSNNLFRSHRQSELRMEVSCIEKLCSNKSATLDAEFVARSMLTRLLYFSGGGTTSLAAMHCDDGVEERNIFSYSFDAVWNSFGLKETLHRLIENPNETSSELRSIFPTSSGKKSKKRRALSLPNILDDATCAKLQTLFAGGNIFDDTGCVDFDRIFTTGDLDKKCHDGAPLYLELGSGAGDWACLQAQLNPLGQYVTVELRADRVFQTFAKGMLRQQPLTNLCCVGSECGSFLRQRIRKGTVDTIFVNHPEPPTQTHGVNEADQADEPAHMLNNKMVISCSQCLLPDGRGRLIIVTDNLLYAQFICRSVSKLLPQVDLVGVAPREVQDLKRIESFDHGSSLNLYEGNPSISIDHHVVKYGASNGTSYFDRLWRTGAGKHADMKRRYIIALRTKGGKTGETGGSNATPKKRKKRSEEKQRRRNERRLKRKLES